ncbi:unnamed protein product, partial [Polarella glacialis]
GFLRAPALPHYREMLVGPDWSGRHKRMKSGGSTRSCPDSGTAVARGLEEERLRFQREDLRGQLWRLTGGADHGKKLVEEIPLPISERSRGVADAAESSKLVIAQAVTVALCRLLEMAGSRTLEDLAGHRSAHHVSEVEPVSAVAAVVTFSPLSPVRSVSQQWVRAQAQGFDDEGDASPSSPTDERSNSQIDGIQSPDSPGSRRSARRSQLRGSLGSLHHHLPPRPIEKEDERTDGPAGADSQE